MLVSMYLYLEGLNWDINEVKLDVSYSILFTRMKTHNLFPFLSLLIFSLNKLSIHRYIPGEALELLVCRWCSSSLVVYVSKLLIIVI
jgi:hypothetical protein